MVCALPANGSTGSSGGQYYYGTDEDDLPSLKAACEAAAAPSRRSREARAQTDPAQSRIGFSFAKGSRLRNRVSHGAPAKCTDEAEEYVMRWLGLAVVSGLLTLGGWTRRTPKAVRPTVWRAASVRCATRRPRRARRAAWARFEVTPRLSGSALLQRAAVTAPEAEPLEVHVTDQGMRSSPFAG